MISKEHSSILLAKEMKGKEKLTDLHDTASMLVSIVSNYSKEVEVSFPNNDIEITAKSKDSNYEICLSIGKDNKVCCFLEKEIGPCVWEEVTCVEFLSVEDARCFITEHKDYLN